MIRPIENSKIEKKEVSFYEEEETDDSFDSFYQDEEDDLSDIDWEEVSLDGSLTVTFGNIRRDRRKSAITKESIIKKHSIISDLNMDSI